MNFETIDWEAEALRVSRAFEVEEECEFFVIPPDWYDLEKGETRELLHDFGLEQHNVEALGEFELTVNYSPESRFYGLESLDTGEAAVISIQWDGSLPRRVYRHKPTKFLVRPLFHLDLLTPEVEAALGVSISANQKLEWTQEYKARYGL